MQPSPDPDVTQPVSIEKPPQTGLKRVFAVSGLVIAAMVGVGLYVFIAGRDEREVKEAVDGFVTAVDTADGAKIIALLCPEEAAGITENENLQPLDTAAPSANSSFAHEVTDVEVLSDAASARVVRPDQEPYTLYLRKDAGAWKICAPAEERFTSARPS